jgi:hypothetical protein
MAPADEVLGNIERYEGMTEEYLTVRTLLLGCLVFLNSLPKQHSKIRKILRRIQDLPASQVPREDEFHFRDRARKLVTKWEAISKAATNSKPGSALDDVLPAAPSSSTDHTDDYAFRAATATATPATEASDSAPAPTTGSTRPLPTPPTCSAPAGPSAKSHTSSQIHVPEYRNEPAPRLPSALDNDPEAQRVRNWRHVLQKKFFTPGRNFDVKACVQVGWMTWLLIPFRTRRLALRFSLLLSNTKA